MNCPHYPFTCSLILLLRRHYRIRIHRGNRFLANFLLARLTQFFPVNSSAQIINRSFVPLFFYFFLIQMRIVFVAVIMEIDFHEEKIQYCVNLFKLQISCIVRLVLKSVAIKLMHWLHNKRSVLHTFGLPGHAKHFCPRIWTATWPIRTPSLFGGFCQIQKLIHALFDSQTYSHF